MALTVDGEPADASPSLGGRIAAIAPAWGGPNHVLVATDNGAVLAVDVASLQVVGRWECGGARLGVGWAGQDRIAFTQNEGAVQMWILADDGTTTLMRLPDRADVVPTAEGIWVSAPQPRLSLYERQSNGSWSACEVRAPDGVGRRPRGLSANAKGTLVLLDGDGNCHLRDADSHSWKLSRIGAHQATLTSDGTALAAMSGTDVLIYEVSRGQVAEQAARRTKVWNDPVDILRWSPDSSMLYAHGAGVRQLRAYTREELTPVLWVPSAVCPAFCRDGSILGVGPDGDGLVRMRFAPTPPRLWLQVTGVEGGQLRFRVERSQMRLGDRVLEMTKRPSLRPSNIYEVVTGAPQDGQQTSDTDAVCELRDGLEAVDATSLRSEFEALVAEVTGPLTDSQRASLQRLCTTVFTDYPSTVERLQRALAVDTATPASATSTRKTERRLPVPTPSTGDASGRVRETKPKVRERAERTLESRTPPPWSLRWWRRTGEVVWHEQSGRNAWCATLEWVDRDWGIAVECNGKQQAEVEWHADSGALLGGESLPTEVQRSLLRTLLQRADGIRELNEIELRVIRELARNLETHEWTSGRRLRQHLNFASVEQFHKVINKLIPRLVRRDRGDPGDIYSLTLPGLLLSEDAPALRMIDCLLGAIRSRYEADPDARWYEWVDLLAAGVTPQQVPLASSVATITLLGWGGSSSQHGDGATLQLGMPQDVESLIGYSRSRTFQQYVMDAANGPEQPAAWDLERPYLNAALWLDDDGSQLENGPLGYPQRVSVDDLLVGPERERGSMPDARDVFIIHGRDRQRVEFFFDFLRRLNLHPLEFQTLIDRFGSGSPYIGDIVGTAFKEAHAVIALFTGDDLAQLRPDLLPATGDDAERQLQPQPRPNVILEAGMALAINRDRTIIVEVGSLRGMSDVAGIHAVRFTTGTAEERNRLASRLKAVGCPVETSGDGWLGLPFPR